MAIKKENDIRHAPHFAERMVDYLTRGYANVEMVGKIQKDFPGYEHPKPSHMTPYINGGDTWYLIAMHLKSMKEVRRLWQLNIARRASARKQVSEQPTLEETLAQGLRSRTPEERAAFHALYGEEFVV